MAWEPLPSLNPTENMGALKEQEFLEVSASIKELPVARVTKVWLEGTEIKLLYSIPI